MMMIVMAAIFVLVEKITDVAAVVVEPWQQQLAQTIAIVPCVLRLCAALSDMQPPFLHWAVQCIP